MTTPRTSFRYKLPHETKLQFLQIFRLLLRETTYLPDSHARRYWRDYVTLRFRRYSPSSSPLQWNKDAATTYKARPISSSQHASMLFDQSRSFLRTLCRANEGFPESMTRVLRHTYGRTGRRKHELLAPYMSPDIPKDDGALQTLVSRTGPYIDRSDNKLPVSEALRAIAAAQKSQPPLTIPGPVLRRIDPVIPERNIWGRPLPIRRVRNLRRKALVDMVTKIMPPLPRDEWERLRELAQGSTLSEGFIERRAGWQANVTHRIPLLAKQSVHKLGPRHLRRRFMKRLWATVFAQCPVLEKHPSKGTWVARFGQVSKQGIIPSRSKERTAWVFRGTDPHEQALGFWSEYNRLHPNNVRRKPTQGEAPMSLPPNVRGP